MLGGVRGGDIETRDNKTAEGTRQSKTECININGWSKFTKRY